MPRPILVVLFLGLYVHSVFSKPSDADLFAEENKQYEQGAGKSHESVQSSEQGEAGKKGYFSHHANEKGETGHHDKERNQKEYAEEGGDKRSHNHDDGYYAADHKEAHGEKGYHYVDSGSYAKGHDTKGHHNIHKLDEFKKKKEFFDEDHDEAHKEKHGAYDVGKEFKNGNFKFAGHAKKVTFEGEFGANGESEKGGHNSEESGYKKEQGQDEQFKDAESYAKKGSSELFKELGFSEKDTH